jgi:tRNA U34 5-carboxymethylaminomethyl modifying GTPase MnmE/TrmE
LFNNAGVTAVFQSTDLHELRSRLECLIDLFSQIIIYEDEEYYRTFFEKQIADLQETLAQSQIPEEYKVAVVGSFKSGKSSFVNALCGTRGLASVNTSPETAAITVFKYGDVVRAEVQMTSKEDWESMERAFRLDPSSDHSRYAAIHRLEHEGKLKSEFSTSLTELERSLIAEPGVVKRIFCADWNNKDSKRAFQEEIRHFMSKNDPQHYFVDRIEVFVPIPFLQGIALIDTPGLNDTDQYRVRLTEEFVDDVDVILFLTNSGASYSQPDKEFITTQLRKGRIKHLVIIVTKVDETYANSLKDAEDKDEAPISFKAHIQLENKRVREQVNRTLNELLSDQNITEQQGYFFLDQLDNVPISFISSHYYRDGKENESGIPQLRQTLSKMLTQSERVVEATERLSDTYNRVYSQTRRTLLARRETLRNDVDLEVVRKQLQKIVSSLNGEFDSFRRSAHEQVESLAKRNALDQEVVQPYIQIILLAADNIILNDFQKEDLRKHWKTRRNYGWGYLHDIQNKIANGVFISLNSVLERYGKRFQATLEAMRTNLEELEKRLLELETHTYQGEMHNELGLTRIFDEKYKADLDDLNAFMNSKKQEIVAHLDNFVSEEVREKISAVRAEVADIWGKGTTWRQDEKVEEFYAFLKGALREELKDFSERQVSDFIAILERKAQLIYPELKQHLDQAIHDHLQAVEIGLVKLNQQQKDSIALRTDSLLQNLDSVYRGETNVTFRDF